MKDVIIDFESYYDKEISVVNMGVPNYVKSTDAYCVSVVDTETGEANCGTIAEMQPRLDQLAKDPTVRPVAANSNFDQAWQEKYGQPFQNEWFCVLDNSAFCQYPRNLAGSAGVVLGEKVDKTTRGEMMGVRFETLPPERQNHVLNYCLNDGIKEAQVLEKIPKMSAFEERVASHTRAINRRGVFIDINLVEEDKTRLEKMRHDAFRAIPWHADSKPLSYEALVRWCNWKGIPAPKSTAKTDEECAGLMSDHPELNAVLGTMRRFRRANTMIKKVEALGERVTTDGILPLDLLYCGAPHTRRWSSKGFNVQNLDKEPLVTLGMLPENFGKKGFPGWDEVFDGSLAVPGLEWVWTRHWLIPRPGHSFLIFDFSQIEPRCLNWLAGNDEMMEALRHGYSYYEAYLKGINALQRVGWSGTPGTLKAEVGVKRYTLIKNESLGCGYGMGADKFQDYVRVNGGGDISTEEAQKTIKIFRSGNQKIVKFWGFLDNLIKTAARDKSKLLSLQLPTGDYLRHFNVRTKSRGYESYTTKGDFSHNSHQPRLWGGVLTENVTQRMARDVMANAILNLERAGLRVGWHCHDEVILEVPTDSKEEAFAAASKILVQAPEWAPDLPLGVEGEFADKYTKK